MKLQVAYLFLRANLGILSYTWINWIWKQFFKDLEELFPSPSDEKTLVQKANDLIDCLKPALSENNLMKIAATPGAFILVTLHDWPSFLNFKS